METENVEPRPRSPRRPTTARLPPTWLPFRDELDEAFHRDPAPWWKINGGAAATALVVVGWTLKERYLDRLKFPATTTGLILLGAAAAIVGAGLSFSLLLRDAVRRRRDRGARVSPLLALAFGSRIVGVMILAALVAAALFILGEWSDFL